MDDHLITPVILCGGSGTRLWPLSRKSYPKQFSTLTGEQSLFQGTVKRLEAPGFAPPLVITGDPFRFIVTDQLTEVAITPTAILIEPEARNTAPAILAAALWLQRTDPDALMLIAPSDHAIPDASAFRDTIQTASVAARDGQIVTFGITPTRPETGYGYLEPAEPAKDAPVPLVRFVEKPDLADAEQMLKGGYLWNAGLFLCAAQTIIDAFQTHAPHLLDPVGQAVTQAEPDLTFHRLAPAPWARAPAQSVDYAIMEKAQNLSVMPYNGEWSDLGEWNAVWRAGEADEEGNVLSANAHAIACENTLLRSESEGTTLVGLGLMDIVAIAMPDAVLVAHRNATQDVSRAVKVLRDAGASQAEAFRTEHRPWGYFETLALGGRFQVKRIVVHPGGTLSLQSHHHRSEHWVVVEGTALVTVDGAEKLVAENQSIYVPLGARHRMQNPGKFDMVLIEVQTGSYLGEDDIVRYEDIYSRS